MLDLNCAVDEATRSFCSPLSPLSLPASLPCDGSILTGLGALPQHCWPICKCCLFFLRRCAVQGLTKTQPFPEPRLHTSEGKSHLIYAQLPALLFQLLFLDVIFLCSNSGVLLPTYWLTAQLTTGELHQVDELKCEKTWTVDEDLVIYSSHWVLCLRRFS